MASGRIGNGARFVLSKTRGTGSGSSGTKNLLISFWHQGHNVGVLSSTDEEFAKKVEQWAKEMGYRVERRDREES